VTDTEFDTIAQQIAEARTNGTPLAPFSTRQPGFDVAAAYRVAGRLRQQRVGRGERVVGRKIGFTNRALWPVYGVDQPIWGSMYDTTVQHAEGHQGRCSLAGLAEPKIEPEIALHFASAPQAGDNAASLLQRIDGIAHAFEIVQSPYPGWSFGTADAVAAGSLHGLLLLGPVVPVSALGPGLVAALAALSLTLWCDGERIDQGVGANVLGSPMQALEHLQRAVAHAPPGDAVQPGEWVSTGTITAAWPVHAGQVWHTTIEGLALPGLHVEFEA
jgi:2-oxo-3-hexenedioate decarboxylase